MIFYLASRYNRHGDMRDVRYLLEARGHKVVARWIDMHGGTAPVSASQEEINADPGALAQHAVDDLEDIQQADAVISFTGGGGKGGRHVEFGVGLALGKLAIIVGQREHVFHALPEVLHFGELEGLLSWLDSECVA